MFNAHDLLSKYIASVTWIFVSVVVSMCPKYTTNVMDSIETFAVHKTDLHSVERLFEKVQTLKMNFEKCRLESFFNWPLPFITYQELAKNGLYYSGKGDKVRCNFCKVELLDWKIGDTPNKEHKKFAPYCDFNNNHPTANIKYVFGLNIDFTGKESKNDESSCVKIPYGDTVF